MRSPDQLDRLIVRVWVITGLVLAIGFVVLILMLSRAYAGERMLCHFQPAADDWHFRTDIPPLRKDKCWYDGPRMKPRSELYWAEVPTAPNIIENIPWQLEPRWQGTE
jgi:hypothetical protein